MDTKFQKNDLLINLKELPNKEKLELEERKKNKICINQIKKIKLKMNFIQIFLKDLKIRSLKMIFKKFYNI